MSDTGHIKCPRCGKELPVSAPEGLCPACLGALNFATETELSGAEMREALPPLTPQELAPHFPQLEILECLGRGGMGVVYKARQRTLNRLVALKLLAPERVQDAKFADRFAREAQALAALNHPNIVTIHDFGKAGGFYYLLMEFVDGLNLRQLLRTRKLQPAEALAIVPPVCEALQYAHDHSIVHRDIKPENLLLAKDGRVKIADFGIAKMLGSDSTNSSISLSSPKGGEGRGEEAPRASLTQQTTMGTPQYMAPEQREQPQNADHRADIYALGVVLYELLTGELPTDKLQPPSKKVQIDVRLDEVVLRALEKSPELRYQTAVEFKTQLETVGRKSSEQERTKQEDITPAKSGPIPRELKVIAGWLMVQGGLALINSLFAFISWGQIFLNLLILHLLIGFGLLSLKAGWWRAAVAMNGIQLFASLVGIPLVLFAGATAGNMLTPGEVFRGQPVILGTMVLIQCVLVITCALVHRTLMRLRREGWFGAVPSKHGTVGFPVAVVVFYTGVILGILFIGALSLRFNRDSAYLLLVGIMAVVSPFAGVMTANALEEVEKRHDQLGLAKIKGWLKALSIVAWVLAVPVVGFAVFFFVAMLSEQSGWNPATSEAVMVPLTWLGAVLLPWAGMRLWRAASQSGMDSHSKKADRKGVLFWVAGTLLVLFLLVGFALLSANARRVTEAQAVARAAAERDAQRVMVEGMPRTNQAETSQNTSNKISAPDQPAPSTHTEFVPTRFGFPAATGIFILGLAIGFIALLIWVSRKHGLKGCLLAGAILLGVLLGLVGLVLLLSFGYRASKVNSFNAPAGTTLDLRPIGLQAPTAHPTGLAMQVQNGFNIRSSGGQLVTFEFFMRQGDDRLDPLPQLTAKLVTAPGKFFDGSVSWMGKRGDDARSTNQLWFWSVNGYQQGGVPLPSRPDYETNLTYHLRSGEVLNWWQLAIPAQVNLMPGAAPQDIPLFRTFGSATLDPKQPKEAIVRVTCEALPAGYQFGRERYELSFGAEHNKSFKRADTNPTSIKSATPNISVVGEVTPNFQKSAIKLLNIENVMNVSVALPGRVERGIWLQSFTELQGDEDIHVRLVSENGNRMSRGSSTYKVTRDSATGAIMPELTLDFADSTRYGRIPRGIELSSELWKDAYEQTISLKARLKGQLPLTETGSSTLFSVTNSVGEAIYGQIIYSHTFPVTAIGAGSVTVLKAMEENGKIDVWFSGYRPAGCRIYSRIDTPADRTGSAMTQCHQNASGIHYFASWSVDKENLGPAIDQVNRLMNRSISVRLDQPADIFSVTNSAGEVFKGSLELVGNKP